MDLSFHVTYIHTVPLKTRCDGTTDTGCPIYPHRWVRLALPRLVTYASLRTRTRGRVHISHFSGAQWYLIPCSKTNIQPIYIYIRGRWWIHHTYACIHYHAYTHRSIDRRSRVPAARRRRPMRGGSHHAVRRASDGWLVGVCGWCVWLVCAQTVAIERTIERLNPARWAAFGRPSSVVKAVRVE